MTAKDYSIVTRHLETGEFNNYVQPAVSQELAIKLFESDFPNNKVIHIWEGTTPPNTYRSLKYIINIGFLAKTEETNTFTKCNQIPFRYTIENGIVHFETIEEGKFHLLLRPMIVSSLQITAENLVGKDATFYLYYQNGAKVKNWHGILTHVEKKIKSFY